MSGSGKSYLTADIIEELLDRPKEAGRIGVVVIDVHGEYVGFKRDPRYGKQTTIFPKEKIRVALNSLTVNDFENLGVELSKAQKRELFPILKDLKRSSVGDPPSLDDLIAAIQKSDIKDNSKRPMVAWMNLLSEHKVVGKINEPMLNELVKPGELSIIDLSDIINHKEKLLIVSRIAKRIFDARRDSEKVPPTLLIVEEAHNFAGEGEAENNLSRNILETIAREGRKFGVALCVITQRPVRLSTTILSQCNTHIILRVTNPNDVQHIVESCEGIDAHMARSITTLQVGEALVVGEATRFPFFMKIRKRKTELPSKEKSLEDAALDFEKKEKDREQMQKERETDIESFI
jgi:DNA helicase HerA-like ATPase